MHCKIKLTKPKNNKPTTTQQRLPTTTLDQQATTPTTTPATTTSNDKQSWQKRLRICMHTCKMQTLISRRIFTSLLGPVCPTHLHTYIHTYIHTHTHTHSSCSVCDWSLGFGVPDSKVVSRAQEQHAVFYAACCCERLCHCSAF